MFLLTGYFKLRKLAIVAVSYPMGSITRLYIVHMTFLETDLQEKLS